jgi:two-component system OmpR family response regulator
VHLLVIEDDARLVRLLGRLLGQDQHIVETATTGQAGLELATDAELDAIVLDVGLPDIDGYEVARRLRAGGVATPRRKLTAPDDYLIKPFAYDELVARLRALGRRPPAARSTPRLTAGPIELDEAHKRVTVGGTDVRLSQREFAILECLLRRPGHVLSRDQLLDYAWPYGAALTPNTVEAYIHLLREKLGPTGAQRIETVRGMGYRLRGD